MSLRFSNASHLGRRPVGDELKEYELAYRLIKYVRAGNIRMVDRVLAEGADIDGSRFMEYRPLMIAAGTTR